MDSETSTQDCSIIICTRNRAESLQRTLSAVLQQRYDTDRLEIVVVDNASTDHTKSIVESCLAESPFRVRYVVESRVGLSHARNRGVEQASGGIVIFLDDDAFPAKASWVQQLVSAYADPRVGAAGGDLVPVWPHGKRPEWMHDQLLYSLGLTRFDHADTTETHYPLYPWGANISYRKERVERLGGFSPRLGRQGGQPLSGEETELCLRLEQTGDKVVYVPGAVVHHDVAPEQLTTESIKHYAVYQGISEARIEVANFTRARLSIRIIRKAALLVAGVAGTLVFSASRSPRLRLLSQFKLRTSRAYLSALLRPGIGQAVSRDEPETSS